MFDAVVVSDGGGERLCDRPQQLVAAVVFLGVVELLEVVDVEEEPSERGTVSLP